MVQQDLRRWRSEPHGVRNQVQRLTEPATRKADQPSHMQGIEMIGSDRQDGRAELLCLGKMALLMVFESLCEGLRYVDWLCDRTKRWRHFGKPLHRRLNQRI